MSNRKEAYKTGIVTALFFLTVLFFACKPSTDRQTKNNDSVTDVSMISFLVFEKPATDSFFNTYEPLAISNKKLIDAIKNALSNLAYNKNEILSKEAAIQAYKPFTHIPTKSSYALSERIMKAGLTTDDDAEFSGALSCFFFHECLPKKFQHKWSQGIMGRFNFHDSFFMEVAQNSKTMAALVNNPVAHWDSKMNKVFNGDTYIEISAADAKALLAEMSNSEKIMQPAFRDDRVIFVDMLEKTVAGQWLMIMMN